MIEKLKKFCGDPRHSEKIGAPWSKGEFSFATNGFILVRVPRLEHVPEREGTVNLKGVLEANPEPADGYLDAPGIEGLQVPPCPKCKGRESTPVPCVECDGSGEVTLGNRYNDYECICKSCGGDGERGRCRECGGHGYLIDSEDANTLFAGSTFKKANILDLTREFGPLQIAPPAESGKASWVRFAGGHALIMPITRAK